MKNLLIICLLVFASSSAMAQSVALKITELNGSPITLKSANLQKVTIMNPRGQSAEGYAYVITRNQNDLTAAIMMATKTKKSYGSAELIVSLKNGKKITHEIKNVVLSDYTSTNIAGKTPLETFYMQFQTDDIKGSK